MINPFKSKRASLIEQKAASAAAHEREDAQRAAAIDRLEADPDYRAFCRAMEVQRDLKLLKEHRRQTNFDARQQVRDLDSQIAAQADGRIQEFIKWANSEKSRVSNAITSRGFVEKNRLGSDIGRLLTNAAKIEAHVAALNHAIAQARRLETSPDDAAVELAKIRASVPMADTTPEELDCDAGFAHALS